METSSPLSQPSTPTKPTSLTSQTQPPSFKEDTYILSNLNPSQLKSLTDFKSKLSTTSSQTPPTIWGVPLLSDTDQSNVILLKFLRARDFKVNEAYTMLQNSLQWRQDFNADAIVDEDLSEFKEFEGSVAYMHGFDKDGHPVCYNSYGVFKDKEVYEKVFGDEEKVKKFLRWRVQVLERGIKMLHFKPGGVNSIIQVTDLKDMPKTELRFASNHVINLFQDNYPEMVAMKIFINVPWYFSLLYSMFSPFLTQRTKSKFVIAKESNVAETLYKFIRPDDVPVQYGGLSRPGDLHNSPAKPASEFTVKGGEKVNIQIEGIEAGATISWDLVVAGWDLEYCAEFIPIAKKSYTLAVEKPKKLSPSDEPVHNSFLAREAGKLVLSVDNTASRKRKVAAYRYIVRKSTLV